MGKVVKASPKNWSTRESLEFYSVSRRRITDLYDSEKVFLPRMLKPGMKVLDVGCALGGFYNIMKEIMPSISYYGCDFAETLIRRAKKDNTGAEFLVANSARLPFADGSFDLVNCAGTCHMIPDYREAIREIYRITGRFCIFDVRLTDRKIDFDMNTCYQKLSFGPSGWDGESLSPYVIVNAREFLRQLLSDLTPKPKAVYATGYLRAPAAGVVAPLREVCMAVFMLEKPECSFNGRTEICMDIPYDYTEEEEFKEDLWFGPSKLHERLGQK